MSERKFETAAECFKSRMRDLAAMHEWISCEMELLNSTYQNGDTATWADAADVGRYRELMMRLLVAMGPLEKEELEAHLAEFGA